MNIHDPDHSNSEQRYVVMGLSERHGYSSSVTLKPQTKLESSAPVRQLVLRERAMKKSRRQPVNRRVDEDTMRPEYDFSKATRGITAARYAEGTNIVRLDPDVAELFPNARAVNEALRTFARLTKPRDKSTGRKKRTA